MAVTIYSTEDVKTKFGEILEANITLTDRSANRLVTADRIGEVSDGYHTFDELYAHRIELFIALCKERKNWEYEVWRSKKHSDGSEIDGWFVMGLNKRAGTQITYDLPIDRWIDCSFAETLETAPPFDGHTAMDVLERLKKL